MRQMPDIANEVRDHVRGTIDRVGMEHIDVPVAVRDAEGRLAVVPGRANAFVSLDDPDAKGIHMSRLFLALQEIVAKEPVTIDTLRQVVDAFLVSHADISRAAEVDLAFDYLVRRRHSRATTQAGRATRSPSPLRARTVKRPSRSR